MERLKIFSNPPPPRAISKNYIKEDNERPRIKKKEAMTKPKTDFPRKTKESTIREIDSPQGLCDNACSFFHL